jgi:glycosyltransferase involved in cell wall biosynthesis
LGNTNQDEHFGNKTVFSGRHPAAEAWAGKQPAIDVLIPAYNEESALPLVLDALPRQWVRTVVVCDNGSTDGTAAAAAARGAVVVRQVERGYGNACLAGINYLKTLPAEEQPDVVVFLDGDFSDYPDELPNVVAPILNDGQDLVIGSRRRAGQQPGAMTLPQRFGNWLAPALIRRLYGYRFSDLGPFRAIRWPRLLALDMQDRSFGWTVEMQVKAAKQGLACAEVPVRYRRRAAGHSKVSGTLKGTVMAGITIIWVILKNLK